MSHTHPDSMYDIFTKVGIRYIFIHGVSGFAFEVSMSLLGSTVFISTLSSRYGTRRWEQVGIANRSACRGKNVNDNNQSYYTDACLKNEAYKTILNMVDLVV